MGREDLESGLEIIDQRMKRWTACVTCILTADRRRIVLKEIASPGF